MMARTKSTALLYSILVSTIGVDAACHKPLVKEAGQVGVIHNWDVQSTAQITTIPLELSKPGTDTSSWHHADVPKCTLMGCLLAAGVYNEGDLFMSDNLKKVDIGQFQVPWLYRTEFHLKSTSGQHYFLQTNGITSRADVFLNGEKVADKTVQGGAYGGHTYDITKIINSTNALVFKVYPTDYLQDFGVGFVDWNPAPPDNGTGVWRDVTIKQTGPVLLGPLRVVTRFDKPGGVVTAIATLKATVQNLEDKVITVNAGGAVLKGADGQPLTLNKSLTLQPLATGEVVLEAKIDNAELWWPATWGSQTLYTAQIVVSVDGKVSDKAERKFGVRQVTHQLNKYSDSTFSINGQPFQVRGAGYTSDIFLRWDPAYFTSQMQYVLDMGLNTIRLEGKLEHPELYDIADTLGIMIMPGWECCDKWEAWSYNDNLPAHPVWSENDYTIANASIRHEAAMLQPHPSVLNFFVGSDFWPNDRAASIYVDALRSLDWPNPITPYAAKKDGYPSVVGPPGMKMDGPYDWIPPNYWWDTQPSSSSRLGAAFGFGSELGPGVGTPELSSLVQFQTPTDLAALWQHPDAPLYHMSTETSEFSTRTIYNAGLYARYGPPKDLDDYLLKSQLTDYEATRAEFESYSSLWSAARPATGLIYWMLNSAWPNLHWSLYDYYLHPAGAYFGAKVAGRIEHVAFDYVNKSVYLINHSLDQTGPRVITWEVITPEGKLLGQGSASVLTEPNKSKPLTMNLSDTLAGAKSVVFLKLVLVDEHKEISLSRNVYWLAPTIDTLDWDDSSWYHTPVSNFSDFKPLNKMADASVSTTVTPDKDGLKLVLENGASVPAFFVRLNLVNSGGVDVTPVFWSDNYVTLWPNETLDLRVSWTGEGKPSAVQISGKNVAKDVVAVPRVLSQRA